MAHDAAMRPVSVRSAVGVLTELDADWPTTTAAVTCLDVGHRGREVLVEALPDQRVLMTVPPGEVADLEVMEAERLWESLRALVPAGRGEPISGVTVWGPFSDLVCCADAVGRPRAVKVVTTPGGWVRVVAPAGGVAVFRPIGLVSFAATLRAAVRALRVEAAIA